MAELDRGERQALLARAEELREHVTDLATARQNVEDAGSRAGRALAARVRPAQVPIPDGTDTQGRILFLRSADEDLLRALRDRRDMPALDPGLAHWVDELAGSLPTAMTDARHTGFVGRLLGRGPDRETQERATDYLMRTLEVASAPATAEALRTTYPANSGRGTGTPVGGPDQLIDSVASALGAPRDRLALLASPDVLGAARTIDEIAASEEFSRSLLEEVEIGVEYLVEATAHRALADVGMTLFRTRTEVARFPASALARAGIDSVADLLSRSTRQLAAVDGISEQTAAQLRHTARDLERSARAQAQIDLTRVDDPQAAELLRALKAVLDDRSRSHGIAADRRGTASLVPLARAVLAEAQAHPGSGPFPTIVGSTPALLIGESSEGGRQLADSLAALVRRHEQRRRGAHLDPTEQERLEATAQEDFAAHPGAYYAILAELGHEDRIATNTHGDLPEQLINLIDDVELDTSLLTLESLRQYQHFAARFAIRQRRVLIGDEMGLGKTIEALAAIAHLSRQGATRTLVVCPAAVLTNWVREISSRSRLEAHRLHGADRDEATTQWQRRGGVGVTTFATLSRLLARGAFGQLDTVVVDEAHKIKNPQAKRTRVTVEQLERADHAILMTGTPIENRLEEFRTLISYLDGDLARTSEGLLPLDFRRHIAPAYLRRNQEDVLKELPDLTEIDEWIEFSAADRREYERAVAEGNFMGMRQAALRSRKHSTKIERLLEIAEEAVETGRKVLVFSYFRSVTDTIIDLLPGAVFGPLTGSVSANARQEMVDEFTAAPGGGILVAQIQAGGEGLNIQAASVVVICEPQLKPSLEVQAIARSYRMGQTLPVQVHRLLSEEGADPRIVELLAEKTQIFDDYARDSATKNADLEATETSDVAIATAVLAEEQERLGV